MERKVQLLSNFRKSVGWIVPPTVAESDSKSDSQPEETKVLSTLPPLIRVEKGEPEGEGDEQGVDEEVMRNDSSGSSCNNDAEICPFFLMGKCRYKSRCKLRHTIDKCPHCGQPMPQGKIAGSTHLSRCYKAKCQ
jgi:hypothetical protein